MLVIENSVLKNMYQKFYAFKFKTEPVVARTLKIITLCTGGKIMLFIMENSVLKNMYQKFYAFKLKPEPVVARTLKSKLFTRAVRLCYW